MESEVVTRICRVCSVEKPIERFSLRNDSGKRRSTCMDCENAAHRKRYAEDEKYHENKKAQGQKAVEKYRKNIIEHPEEAMANKVCRVCGVEKTGDQFIPRGYTCKECNNAYLKRYHEDHREELKAKAKQHREEHPEEIKASKKRDYEKHHEKRLTQKKQYNAEHREEIRVRKKRYYEEHREEQKEKSRRYTKEHPEKVKARNTRYREERREEIKVQRKQFREGHREELREQYKRTYLKHREKRNAESRRYHKEHPEKVRVISRKHRAKRQNLPLPNECIEYELFIKTGLRTCVYCGRERLMELEHQTPVSRGGTNDLSNITESCSECNRGRDGKNRMTLEEFAASGKMKLSLSKVVKNIKRSHAEFLATVQCPATDLNHAKKGLSDSMPTLEP